MRGTLRALPVIAIVLSTGGCAPRGMGVAYRGEPVEVMCVVNNPEVTVPGFERDLLDQLHARAIQTEVVPDLRDCDRPYALTYVARRSLGVVSRITLGLYKNQYRVAFIKWDSGRGAGGPEVSDEVFDTVEYWQLAEALGGLMGEIQVDAMRGRRR